MKKTVTIFGIIGAVVLTIGAIFKLLHWPGAGIILTLGALCLVIYACLYLLEQINSFNTKIGKAYAAIFGIAGILMIIGFLFKLMHWPGTGYIIIVFFIFFAGLLVVSLIRAILEKDKELRNKYTNIFIFLLGGGLMLLYPTIYMMLNK